MSSEDAMRAYRALRSKQQVLAWLFAYYENEAPAPLVAERLRQVYQDRLRSVDQNWCSVVIDTLADRISLERIEGADQGMTNDLKVAVDTSGLMVEVDESITQALIAGESFLFSGVDVASLDRVAARVEAVDSLPNNGIGGASLPDVARAAGAPGSQPAAPGMLERDSSIYPGNAGQLLPDALDLVGDTPIEVYCVHPCQAHAFYDPLRPNIMVLACKWYEVDAKTWHIALYYPDRVETWAISRRAVTEGATKPAIVLVDETPNPYGVIPVFHLRTRRRAAVSELKNVIPLQDAVNILGSNLLITSEFSAAPIKYVITNGEIKRRLKASPNEIWDLPAGDGEGESTKVGALPASDLENYAHGIDQFLQALISISRTPRHYFVGGEAPSGEALRVMESPLVKKANDRMAVFTPVLQQLGAFLARLMGNSAARSSDIVITWRQAETMQPVSDAMAKKATAEAALAEHEIGIPFAQLLKDYYGYTDTEIAAFTQQIENERANMGAAMLRQFDRGAGQQFGAPDQGGSVGE